MEIVNLLVSVFVPNYDHEKYLDNIEQVLSKNGLLIILAPIVNQTTKRPYNPHHVMNEIIPIFIN
jgi:hypothetical protein